jgi:membrane dipeptidase
VGKTVNCIDGSDVRLERKHLSSLASVLRPARPLQRVRWEALWPPGSQGTGTRDPRAIASLAWTNWPVYTVGLVQRGYRDADIQKILGGNMLRVLKANES